jgi:endonuclease YncB( thermonuclease family)
MSTSMRVSDCTVCAVLVSAGLTRIYGTRTPLPDGRNSREYLAHLCELESEAKSAKRGAWGKVNL